MKGFRARHRLEVKQALSLSLSLSLSGSGSGLLVQSLSFARSRPLTNTPTTLLPSSSPVRPYRPPTPTIVWARASGCDRGRRWFKTMFTCGVTSRRGSLHPPRMCPRVPAPPHPHQHHPRVKRDTPPVHQPTSLSPLHPGTAQPPTPTPTPTLLPIVRTRPSSACWPPKNFILVVTH
jgi:hypothetical protein